jgi:hypothetical protein
MNSDQTKRRLVFFFFNAKWRRLGLYLGFLSNINVFLQLLIVFNCTPN